MRRARIRFKGSVFTLYVDDTTLISEIVEDAKRYFRVRSEEAFLSHLESNFKTSSASDVTAISIGDTLEFQLKASQCKDDVKKTSSKIMSTYPKKIAAKKRIDKDLILETKMLMRDVFLYYTGKRGFVNALNRSDWNHIMIPRFIKSKHMSNSVYDRVARNKNGLLRFGSFLNAVSIVFGDNVERVRDEFALPLHATNSLHTNRTKNNQRKKIPHLMPSLRAVFRSYLDLEERRNVRYCSSATLTLS